MVRYCVMIAAAVIGLAALGFVIKLLILRIFGIETEAEVVAVKEPERGRFVHTLRFEINGKTVEKDDKTGYSQGMTIGERRSIVCAKKDASNFEYSDQLRKNIAVAGVLVVMAVLMVLRFAFFVTDGEMEDDVKLSQGLFWLL